MKNFIIFTLCFTLFVLGIKIGGQAQTTQNVKIYYIDRTLRTFVPMPFSPKSKSAEKIASEIIAEIARKDGRSGAISLIPDRQKDISAEISGSVATIDIANDLAEILPKNRETEQLFIYQLVNSICTIEGVSTVRFTIGGQSQKSFLGFFDMREIFTPKDIV